MNQLNKTIARDVPSDSGQIWVDNIFANSVNPLYSEFHFLEVMDTLYAPYFHFCWELVLETWARGSSMNSLRVCDLGHTHSLASLQWSPTEKCLQCQKWSPYKSRFLHPFVVNGEKCPSQYWPRPFYSQPGQPPCAWRVMTMPAHLPQSHLFC